MARLFRIGFRFQDIGVGAVQSGNRVQYQIEYGDRGCEAEDLGDFTPPRKGVHFENVQDVPNYFVVELSIAAPLM
ncbi:hypothetical protein PENSUB_13615 [Penicillium subrubescens]|uniref:Uncharacterized protein n=1 Tax=Penicillium subrubescens TaxID=1316194 RepID=A0A1Q5SNG4_9EURO|nr:hypothetical protein PENSUB_13615 [Penicillium subrubescens]